MPEAKVNGVRLYYELHGSGEPLALVHGSWVDATSWGFVVPGLAESFRVLVYDRRGHSRSERPERGRQWRARGARSLARCLPRGKRCHLTIGTSNQFAPQTLLFSDALSQSFSGIQ